MKSGHLIKVISNALGIDQATVHFVARKLREAGFLTTGARGVNAPDMTTRDAARLTLALMTGAPPNRIVDTFEIYRQFRNDEFEHIESAKVIQRLDFKRENTAEDFLVYLFDFVLSHRSNSESDILLNGLEFNVHEKPAYVIFKNAGLEIYFTAVHLSEMKINEFEDDPTMWSNSGPAGLFEMEGMHVMRQISLGEIEAIASEFGTE
ncbi:MULTISPECIES: hypothetical protein [unclassified Ruegeria]|uniref:hypothetical protein n=1 Tax=unclassified Ruegeria TaxID=2625375 RepID=UPI001491E0DC|nr:MULTISPECIES: hypothetical protein [unclassified Ruegeria]NOD48924.1 hypothetical protein [Ruegeria sp. HKCCD5849]NOD53571.1 hypothetical protein [Ruegeria sp. HKCCD5851]NOD69446.1 hypothetical protein [Ruegeria sp. HKCCD7303]